MGSYRTIIKNINERDTVISSLPSPISNFPVSPKLPLPIHSPEFQSLTSLSHWLEIGEKMVLKHRVYFLLLVSNIKDSMKCVQRQRGANDRFPISSRLGFLRHFPFSQTKCTEQSPCREAHSRLSSKKKPLSFTKLTCLYLFQYSSSIHAFVY